MSKRRKKKRVLGRAPVPPPGGRHKDKKKWRDKKRARERVSWEDVYEER